MTIHCGDALAVLRTLAPGVARCCVTSPPYWGLRDYGVSGQLGLERTPDEYVASMVEVFREVRRVLADDGTLWLNIGDSYCSQGGGLHDGRDDNQPGVGARRVWRAGSGRADGIVDERSQRNRNGNTVPGLKPKDLVGIPWMVAFALRADGWHLRQDIIWHKPNPMPESVRDRCTKSHEHIFLLSKSKRYYWDSGAAKEPAVGKTRHDLSGPGYKAPGQPANKGNRGGDEAIEPMRNRRDVWTISTKPFKGAHFATFPPDLVEPCVRIGSAPGDTVLDPFSGAGTVGLVARREGREYVGIELNPEYVKMSEERIQRG